MCNVHDNENGYHDHLYNTVYDLAYIYGDAHHTYDHEVIDGEGDDDDDDDGDYDYAPAASMEGYVNDDGSLAPLAADWIDQESWSNQVRIKP